MASEIAIIGGSGFDEMPFLEKPRLKKVSTKYGEVEFKIGNFRGREIIFLLRHGTGYSLIPSRINFLANISALAQEKAKYILATAAVGSMNLLIKPGDLLLLSDFIDFTTRREKTLFLAGKPIYTDMREAYSTDLREKILKAAKRLKIRIHKKAVYVCTEGPRYETPAEIKMYKKLGADVVGMTQIPEVVLANEAGIHYAALGVVTNWAAGLSKTKLSSDDILKISNRTKDKVYKLFEEVVKGL